jgi:hypothetical protein
MEKENMELYQEVQGNVAAQNRADAKTAEIFAFFDEVCARLWQCYRPSVLTSTAPLAVVFSDLRKVEGTSFGGHASVDAVDCRDSERHQPSAMMHKGETSFTVYYILRNLNPFTYSIFGSCLLSLDYGFAEAKVIQKVALYLNSKIRSSPW